MDGALQAMPVGLDKSSAVSSLADANAFIVLPGGTRGFETGMKVSVLLLEHSEGCEWPWAKPSILQIVGYQNSGKTTLVEKLCMH